MGHHWLRVKLVGASVNRDAIGAWAELRAGDTVRARATILEINAKKRRVTIETVATVGETVVLDGEALILVPSREA